MLERVKAEQVVDVFQAIKTLRIQRVGLMETLVRHSSHKANSRTFKMKRTYSVERP